MAREDPVWRRAILTLALITGAAAQPSPVPPVALPDVDGNPLPDGAVARLGSARFRHFAVSETTMPVAFSPDGKLLAIAAQAVFLFDVATGRLVHHLQLPDGYHSPFIRFLADGKRLAVGPGHYPRQARLTFYTLADGRPTASPDFKDQRATHVIDITPDGSRALLLEWGKQVYMWDFKGSTGSCGRSITPAGRRFCR